MITFELDMAVLELHNIARLIEDNIGKGNLSEDLRNCADRLHALTKENYINKKATSEENN